MNISNKFCFIVLGITYLNENLTLITSSAFQDLIKAMFERSLSQRKVFLTGDLMITADNVARASIYVLYCHNYIESIRCTLLNTLLTRMIFGDAKNLQFCIQTFIAGVDNEQIVHNNCFSVIQT